MIYPEAPKKRRQDVDRQTRWFLITKPLSRGTTAMVVDAAVEASKM
jgi:hypothetical protein